MAVLVCACTLWCKSKANTVNIDNVWCFCIHGKFWFSSRFIAIVYFVSSKVNVSHHISYHTVGTQTNKQRRWKFTDKESMCEVYRRWFDTRQFFDLIKWEFLSFFTWSVLSACVRLCVQKQKISIFSKQSVVTFFFVVQTATGVAETRLIWIDSCVYGTCDNMRLASIWNIKITVWKWYWMNRKNHMTTLAQQDV